MSSTVGTNNQTGLRIKELKRKIGFMEEYSKEEMSKHLRKRFNEYLELTKQEEQDIIEVINKTGGAIK